MSEFTGPTLGSVVITLNTDAAGLQFLIDEAYGLRYSSHDKGPINRSRAGDLGMATPMVVQFEGLIPHESAP